MKTLLKTFVILVSTLITISILSTLVYAKPNKNKNKNKHHTANKQIVVVQKEVVRKKYVPANINTWTTVNAPIYSSSCPYSCATEGINKNHCRDWRNGNVCFVQDTSLNTYDYSADRYLVVPGESAGEVIGRKIDQAVTNVLR